MHHRSSQSYLQNASMDGSMIAITAVRAVEYYKAFSYYNKGGWYQEISAVGSGRFKILLNASARG